MTLTRKLPPMGNRAGQMKKPKPIKLTNGLRRRMAQGSSKAPITLPKAPWDAKTEKEVTQ